MTTVNASTFAYGTPDQRTAGWSASKGTVQRLPAAARMAALEPAAGDAAPASRVPGYTYNKWMEADIPSGDTLKKTGATFKQDFGAMVDRQHDNLRAAGRESVNTVGRAASALTGVTPRNNDSGFVTFIKTVVDIINPLHHIPVVGTIYRQMTEDHIDPVSQIVGGSIFGGPVGAIFGVANVAVDLNTGRDIGETVLAYAGFENTFKQEHTVPAAEDAPAALSMADITWHTPAPDDPAPAMPAHPAIAVDVLPPLQDNAADANAFVAGLGASYSPPSDTPTSLRTRTAGAEPAQSLPYAPPVLSPKGETRVPARDAVARAGYQAARGNEGDRNSAGHSVAAPFTLSAQDAPAGTARMTAPPEHIALSSSLAAQMATLQPAAGTATDYSAPLVDNAALPMRMMEALDKYAAMKAAQTGGGVSGAY